MRVCSSELRQVTEARDYRMPYELGLLMVVFKF